MVQGPRDANSTKHWLTYSHSKSMFALDTNYVSIKFDTHGADVGCHRISLEAMNALTQQWQEFIGAPKERVVQ